MRQAERTYRSALELYPKSVKLLRCYARFLQGIKGNPHAAMRYFADADRLEEQQAEVGVQGAKGAAGLWRTGHLVPRLCFYTLEMPCIQHGPSGRHLPGVPLS